MMYIYIYIYICDTHKSHIIKKTTFLTFRILGCNHGKSFGGIPKRSLLMTKASVLRKKLEGHSSEQQGYYRNQYQIHVMKFRLLGLDLLFFSGWLPPCCERN